ncbi:MAG: Ig-like domain-containing protein, partial [Ilumatobacteraceae bacterium]
AGDVARRIPLPKSKSVLVARDGSMWVFTAADTKHFNVDGSIRTFALRGIPKLMTTVGTHAVFLDTKSKIVHWPEGGDVSVGTIPNLADAALQTKGDDNSCVWLGAGDTLACVGKTGIDRIFHVPGLTIGANARLAVAGDVAVVLGANNQLQRINTNTGKLLTTGGPEDIQPDANLTITAVNGMVWIDEPAGDRAWVIHDFGVSPILKNDTSAPSFDAQGQVQDQGTGIGAPTAGAGNVPGSDTETDHLDHNGVDNPPKAVDDSVTARAGTTITIPVTANDWDPDGNAIALISAGIKTKAGHGTVDVLDGTSVAYKPLPGYSGPDQFDYTIIDEHGNPASAMVKVQLFAPDSPNRPPIATPDHVKTRIGHAVTIDVLANDIDPERDVLSVPTFSEIGLAKITPTKGPTGLQALRYQPPDAPGVYTFKYQAADPQGGTSAKTTVTVDVLGDNSPNVAPTANPDALRLPVGKPTPLDVRANDVDPDGDEMTIATDSVASGVEAVVRSQQLVITLGPGAKPWSLVTYKLSDTAGHTTIGHVLVVRLDDSAPNRPPVANPDTERVVVGNSVKIPVTANDVDPDLDTVLLLSVGRPDGGVGTTAVEGNFVRFTPNLPDITKPTPVSFNYKIGDGHGNVAFGTVTVTVLAEALPSAPFARDDFADTFTDKPVNIDVLANDSDPSGGTPHLSEAPACPTGGSATITAAERVTFVPPAGENGTFRCKYRVSNDRGLPAEAWIIVTVTPAPPGNHPPQPIDLTPLGVKVGDSITISAASLATDVDNDTLTFSSVSKPFIGSTSFTQKADSFTYFAPAPGSADDAPTSAFIDVIISDGHDGNVPVQIPIRIIPTTPAVAPVTHDIPRNMTLGDVLVPIDVVAELRD